MEQYATSIGLDVHARSISACVRPTGARRGNWTRAWWSCCRAISFAEPDARAAFEHYKDEVRRLEDAKRAIARKVAEAAGRPRWKPRVDALRSP